MNGLLATLYRLRQHRDLSAAVLASYALMAGNVLVQVFLVPLYLEKLGQKDFGVLMVILSLINFSAVGVGWLSGSALRVMGEYAATGERAAFSATLRAAKRIYLGYATLVSAVAVAAVALGAWAGAADYFSVTLVCAVYFVLQYELAVERLALTALGKQAAGNLNQLAALLLFAAGVVFSLQRGYGLAGVFFSLIASTLLARLLLWWLFRRPDSGGERPPMNVLVRRLTGSLGGGYFAYGLLLLTLQSDVIILGWIGGAVAAAKYVLVWKIAEVGVQFLWRIPEALAPHLVHMDARQEGERLQRTFRTFSRWLFLAALAGGATYALLGPWITRLWLGPEKAPHDWLGFALAGGALFWLAIARLPSVYAYSLARLRPLNLVAGSELLAKTVLTLALFPKLDYLAPLAAINIVHLSGVAYAYWRVGRASPGSGAKENQ